MTARNRRRAAARVAAREAAAAREAHRAGRFATGAHAAATAAETGRVDADVRAAAAGQRASVRRDTSRRRVGLAGHRAIDPTGWNVDSTRREWAGEDGRVTAGPLDAKLAQGCEPHEVPMLTGDGVNPSGMQAAPGVRGNVPAPVPARLTPKPTRRVAGKVDTVAAPGERLARAMREARRR